MSVVGGSRGEQKSRKHQEGLYSKMELSLYRMFSNTVEFKTYLHMACDAESGLIFKNSWT